MKTPLATQFHITRGVVSASDRCSRSCKRLLASFSWKDEYHESHESGILEGRATMSSSRRAANQEQVPKALS